MASLSSLLPAPVQQVWDRDDEQKSKLVGSAVVISQTTVPPYGQRKGWIPRVEDDFADGGAFPEIHVAQYPLGMGARGKESTSNALAVQLDESGKVKYSAIARQGHSADKIIYSKLTDLLPSEVLAEDDATLQKPTEDDIQDITEKTKQALEKLTNAKISAALPVKAAPKAAPAQYIRYTPAQQGGAFNSGAKQRVIRMVEAQSDPLEPPRFQINRKIPRAAPSPPAPVLHSPPRRVSVKQQRDWKVPPCVSHWKNAKGYTIPLDKRLAADGRGLQQVHINENFSKLAEALYIADRKAREAVEARAQLERRLAQREKEKKEEHLRMLAQRARDHRAGIRNPEEEAVVEEGAPLVPEGELSAAEREKLRSERHRERQRDRNLARAAPDKRSKLVKDRERDISEQIALGLPAKTAQGGEGMFDQRLFNNSRGMDSGYADDEAYNVYDKPWRNQDTVGAHIYRPTRNADKDNYGGDLDTIANTKRFVADKGFAGTSSTNTRSGPVNFEKDAPREEPSRNTQPEADFDPFGLDRFLSEAKRADKSSRKRDHHEPHAKKRRD
ncbi:puff-specific protein Bx42 isoform X2 [Pararge aegeria]|uniref:puff-specific protein Bx42 isoform X2 n=1 Tax=Pararge aegeria TaxID=116150 RepID=UPI0019D0DA2D|nr:puff-specific protein Bx42 isoform X2 [Pararge aegeria]